MSWFLWSPSQIFFLCSTSKILGKSEILWLQSGFLKLVNSFSCCREVGSKFVAPNLKKISKTEENVLNERLGRAIHFAVYQQNV